MVRQRTKRWGFDMGGEYIMGILKQEWYPEDNDKPTKRKIRTVKKKVTSSKIFIDNPLRN